MSIDWNIARQDVKLLAVISKYEISSTVAQWLLLLLHSSDVCGDFHRKASIDDDRKKHA